MKKTQAIKNENGSVLVIALIMLVLLTLMGIAATSTSNIELQISGNERNFKRTFFAANAGIEHAKGFLNADMISANQANFAAGTISWDFILWNATGTGYELGKIVIDDNTAFTPLNGYNYSVRIWNNTEIGGSETITDDADGIIWLQANATGPNHERINLKVQLKAVIDGAAIASYTAQQGGESSKGYSSQDLNPVSAYTGQMGSGYSVTMG